MKAFTTSALSGLFVLLTCGTLAYAQGAHEKSVNIPADELKFLSIGAKANGKEMLSADAFGSTLSGAHRSFLSMPAGFVTPAHTHSQDYFAVVIKGVMANHAPGEKDVPLPVGSYWSQKAGEGHVTKCISKTDCLFFSVQPGKFDFALVKE